MIELTMPLWLALVIAAILGAVIANLGGWLVRRRG
jgi:ABC-type branched-subunit amino acid transport system permease subunit